MVKIAIDSAYLVLADLHNIRIPLPPDVDEIASSLAASMIKGAKGMEAEKKEKARREKAMKSPFRMKICRNKTCNKGPVDTANERIKCAQCGVVYHVGCLVADPDIDPDTASAQCVTCKCTIALA